MPSINLSFEKPSTMEEQKVSVPTIMQPVDGRSESSAKSIRTKWVAIGAIVVTIVVVAGFVAAFCFMYRTSATAIKSAQVNFKDDDGKTVDETIDTYDDDTIVYSMTTANGEQSVIVEDYGKKLEVSKMMIEGRPVCYVTPLNKTRPLSTSNIDTQDTVHESVQTKYEASPDPVSDPSFLGAKARETCKGAPVYWVSPVCGEEQTDKDAMTTQVGSRQKRSATFTCRAGCCYDVCCCMTAYIVTRSADGTIRCNWYCQQGCSVYYRYYC